MARCHFRRPWKTFKDRTESLDSKGLVLWLTPCVRSYSLSDCDQIGAHYRHCAIMRYINLHLHYNLQYKSGMEPTLAWVIATLLNPRWGISAPTNSFGRPCVSPQYLRHRATEPGERKLTTMSTTHPTLGVDPGSQIFYRSLNTHRLTVRANLAIAYNRSWGRQD